MAMVVVSSSFSRFENVSLSPKTSSFPSYSGSQLPGTKRRRHQRVAALPSLVHTKQKMEMDENDPGFPWPRSNPQLSQRLIVHHLTNHSPFCKRLPDLQTAGWSILRASLTKKSWLLRPVPVRERERERSHGKTAHKVISEEPIMIQPRYVTGLSESS